MQLLIAVLDEGLAAELLDDFVARSEDFLAKGLAHVRLKDGPVARDLRHLVCFELRDELDFVLSFDNLGNFFAIGLARLHRHVSAFVQADALEHVAHLVLVEVLLAALCQV